MKRITITGNCRSRSNHLDTLVQFGENANALEHIALEGVVQNHVGLVENNG